MGLLLILTFLTACLGYGIMETISHMSDNDDRY